MKILTLNTHSLQEENYEEKLGFFLEFILREQPDLIALQEVNQSADAAVVHDFSGMVKLPGCEISLKEDNHALRIARQLEAEGFPVSWVYLPIKLGYGKYDEGVAVLSLGRKIRCLDQFPISKVNDYYNWRTRAVLGVQVEGLSDWFYTVHMGWWDDPEERFVDQWKLLNCCIAAKRMCGTIWLLGDFNAPDTVHGQSYEHMIASGWYDTFQQARRRDSGITVPGAIDGWRDHRTGSRSDGMRLDYIWCSRKKDILSSRVMYNGVKEQVVSDHFGVLIETAE